MSTPHTRLKKLLSELSPSTSGSPQTIGTLELGGISYDVPAPLDPTRLPHCKTSAYLDVRDGFNYDGLNFMLQKFLLGQDVFLLSQPGLYARRLVMTFCRMINSEYEYIALHRDVGETELKQGREIRRGGTLGYVDSAAVRAVKHGRILILEGIEKAERGIMPKTGKCENIAATGHRSPALTGYRNLDDGTYIIHSHRYELLDKSADEDRLFMPAHKNFRVVAIAAPVPPYPGYPLDPPFRSRFQARFIDPVGSLTALETPDTPGRERPVLYTKLREIILSAQFASEAAGPLGAILKSTLPQFPQTALTKLSALCTMFSPPTVLSPNQLAILVLSIHPALVHASLVTWALLSRQTEEAGVGTLGNPRLGSSEGATGLLGYSATGIERVGAKSIKITFVSHDGTQAIVQAPAGPRPLHSFNLDPKFASPRFKGLLSAFLQAHALGWDISYVPPALPSTASCSTSTLIAVFASLLGYEVETIHMYKELGGREIAMRRKIENDGSTTWEPRRRLEGRLVHLSGLDAVGPTAGSLARLVQDREIELWETKRIVSEVDSGEELSDDLSICHPSFRIIATASKAIPLKDWLTHEHANMFFTFPSQPMDQEEECKTVLSTGCPVEVVEKLLAFAEKYRNTLASDSVQKNRKFGTRTILRIAKRMAMVSHNGDRSSDELYVLINRSILAEFLPTTERTALETLLKECDIRPGRSALNPSPIASSKGVIFPDGHNLQPTFIPKFDPDQDRDGVAKHIPHMDHFYENSLQTGLMRDLAVDLELLGEHLVLLGNQGVGKNKLIDRLCQILGRPREYIQLHRDSTVNQLMFQTSLQNGVIKYEDSPLLRAVSLGRVIVVDEADKAPEHVVAVFRSLAGHGEMSLADGRRIRFERERENDVVVHPNFRLILLANRPGYPFLGNHFLQVLGDNFSCHSITNPDAESEKKLLAQLAPDLNKNTLSRLVAAFQDLREGYNAGSLVYPYSLRELINVVRHMNTYPDDSLETALRNTFDFDVYRKETIQKLSAILERHGLAVKNVGLDAARAAAAKKPRDVKFEPKGDTSLNGPKHGKDDPKNEPHQGGNQWAGGTGGRDTAGLGGRGGYKRLFKNHEIKQIPDSLKKDVPQHIQENARRMAQGELARRLEELNLSAGDAAMYDRLLSSVQSHVVQLHDLLENLAAKEEERVWIKRQTDGELDFGRLADGLMGEASIYKKRGMARPDPGRPQIKPKRIRILFDLSASMYRFQHDGRLLRSQETAVMLMESFVKLDRKDKYVWDIYGHSGDSPDIPLVETHQAFLELKDRVKVVEKMDMIPQYTFAGDYTVEAIEKASQEVMKFDADDWFVITVTDANFGRYNITPEYITRTMAKFPRVNNAVICLGDGLEVALLTQKFPRTFFRIQNTADIPNVLRSILSSMVEK
ncbi:hypothetical protein BDM02DRAFT_3187271 [Thelephora ganbajun]|uniref:Uncharacterized protein n=1 Tax=Thelephora ganbajun TaxID=370292 RepID=A0ACB6ZFI5_THEGA|nr:hypothetical protein BDM02DRAFT_3187271 [Thelephora ganbajun]